MNSCPVNVYNFNHAKIKYVSVWEKIAEKNMNSQRCKYQTWTMYEYVFFLFFFYNNDLLFFLLLTTTFKINGTQSNR